MLAESEPGEGPKRDRKGRDSGKVKQITTVEHSISRGHQVAVGMITESRPGRETWQLATEASKVNHSRSAPGVDETGLQVDGRVTKSLSGQNDQIKVRTDIQQHLIM